MLLSVFYATGMAFRVLTLDGVRGVPSSLLCSMAFPKAVSYHLLFFNVLINIFIVRLRQLSIGCHLRSMYIGCLLYADDMLLICPSVRGLQHMLDVCVSIGDSVSLQFNASKSHCMAIGKMSKLVNEPMNLSSATIAWVTSVKYLGTTIMGGKLLAFNSSCVKQSFFAACNSIYAHAKDLDELVHLTLQESYCLPILAYAAAAAKYRPTTR